MVSQDRSTSPSGQSPSSPSPPIQNPQPRKARGIFLLAGLCLIGAVVAYRLLTGTTPDSVVVVDEKLHTIQLDVLNAAGETKLAQRTTDYLRSRGFDVVELGNYNGELRASLVVDRSGNLRAAQQVANALGVSPEQVIQKIDKTLYLDVSVYIGKDFKSLHPFK